MGNFAQIQKMKSDSWISPDMIKFTLLHSQAPSECEDQL